MVFYRQYSRLVFIHFWFVRNEVLGKSDNAYKAYAALIRKEYEHVPYQIYCLKRAEILQQFLDSAQTIYKTALFRLSFEQQARENVQREIQFLHEESKGLMGMIWRCLPL